METVREIDDDHVMDESHSQEKEVRQELNDQAFYEHPNREISDLLGNFSEQTGALFG